LTKVTGKQTLMLAIDQGAAATKNAKRLIDMATLLTIPIVFTEQ
jgi:hypothetical protein